MKPESGRNFSRQETRESKRWKNHWQLRKSVKDLREQALQSDPNFPQRERLMQLTEELLNVIPPVDEQSERLDERRRAMDRGEVDPFND